MKKILKRVLITFCGLIVLIVLFCGIVIISGTSFEKYQENDISYSNWMNYIDDEKMINEIVIPGAHDAGTNTMPWLSKTQNFSIKEQLLSGIRYFDLRVNKVDEQLVIYHDIINGCEFIPVLNDIKDFIINNPTETLLLDFQHFKNGSQESVYNLLKENFYQENLLVENNSSISDLEFVSYLKLKDARGKCIIFFGDYEQNPIADNYKYIFARNNDLCSLKNMSLNSCYISSYNKGKSEEYIKNGLPQYLDNIKEKISEEQHKGIFVLQGQLTDGKLIFGPYSREKKHDKNMSNYILQLNDHEDLKYINIIMRDFINARKSKEILYLNYYKNNIKVTFVDEFVNQFA